ncbi:hypothetical protein PF70_06547, partial [Pseudomonas asplenii]
MFADAAPSLLLTHSSLRETLPARASERPLYCLDSDQARWAGQSTDNPGVAIGPDNLAYV